MPALPITSLYAALCGLLILTLSARVVFLRRSARIGIGTGDHPELTRRIRVHGNAIETIPIALILLLLAEAGGSALWLLHGCGAGLVLSRLLHAIGLTQSAGYSPGRFWGTLLSWIVMLALSLALLFNALPL